MFETLLNAVSGTFCFIENLALIKFWCGAELLKTIDQTEFQRHCRFDFKKHKRSTKINVIKNDNKKNDTEYCYIRLLEICCDNHEILN